MIAVTATGFDYTFKIFDDKVGMETVPCEYGTCLTFYSLKEKLVVPGYPEQPSGIGTVYTCKGGAAEIFSWGKNGTH
jgi:hypothetical protein